MSAVSPEAVERLRDRVEELERLLGMRAILPRLWRLTRREAEVLGILLKRQVMPQEQIFAAIWGGESDCSLKIVEVIISKLRAKLRPFGIEIRNEYGVGYFVPPDSKTAARAQIAVHERESA